LIDAGMFLRRSTNAQEQATRFLAESRFLDPNRADKNADRQ
jgi:hypothetical protein